MLVSICFTPFPTVFRRFRQLTLVDYTYTYFILGIHSNFLFLDSSSSASSECGCRRRHHRHHKSRCCCSESSEDTTTSAPVTTTPAATTTTAFSCDKSSIDLVFVVDTSGSVGIDNFNKTLEALVSIVQNITVGPNDDVVF